MSYSVIHSTASRVTSTTSTTTNEHETPTDSGHCGSVDQTPLGLVVINVMLPDGLGLVS